MIKLQRVGKAIVLLSLVILVFSLIVLNSIAPFLFPNYYLYIFLAFGVFYLFYKIDFDILELFSTHLYIISLVLLLLPIIFGEVTRGAIRWIALGGLTFQPSEIVRPFLFLFAAVQISSIRNFSIKRVSIIALMLVIPLILIFFQPSLGVTIMTSIGFLGALFSRKISFKYILYLISLAVICVPVFWFILAPYQRERITSFINPWSDPLGSGYNSIQSMISVASGEILGRGLGKGIQTQLSFLPERHTDFIFAAIGEELGFVGSFATIVMFSLLFWFILQSHNSMKQLSRKCFIGAAFLSLFAQTSVHVGMNLGLLPVTGLPLPLVSAGGSALLGTSIILGIMLSAVKSR